MSKLQKICIPQRLALAVAIVSMPLSLLPLSVNADEIDDLQRELEAAQKSIRDLQLKVKQVEAQQKQSSVMPVASEDEKSFEVYGFAQLDYIQDFNRVNPAWDSTLRPSRIPTVDGQYGSDGQAILSVRQSRLGVNASLPVGGKTLFTKFEFDMFGVGSDEGQTTIRLRHAYGEWGSILAGQTNSLFMDGDMFPNVIDYWGPAGMVFLRNPQLRWTPIKGNTSFAVAIENPGVDADTSTVVPGMVPSTIQGNETFPDITAQYRMSDGWGHVQVAGILRQLSYENLADDNQEPNGDEIGWGIDLTSNFKMPSGTLRLSTVYGEGIASYMNDGGMDMAVDSLSDEPMAPVPLIGVLAYYDHNWNEQYSSSIGYSYTEVDNQRWQSASAFEKGEYASVNLLFSPTKQFMTGIEYLWGQRTDNGGRSGSDSRIQVSVKYSFTSLDFGH